MQSSIRNAASKATDTLKRIGNSRGRRMASRRARVESLEPRDLLAGGVYAQSLGTPVQYWSENPRGGFVDSYDRIVMTANMILDASNDLQVAVFRATPNGDADVEFSGDGRTTTNASIGLSENPLDATEYTYNGAKKYLVAGRDYNSIPFLMRYNDNGTLDATFGTQGIAKLSSGGQFADVLVQEDGKILVTGSKRVVRYTSAGALDRTFGNKGILDVPSVMRYSSAMALQTVMVNGKEEKCVVVGGVGKSSTDPDDNLVVARYRLSNGSLDLSFGGGDGIVVTDVRYGDRLTDLEVVGNNIIAVGCSYGSDVRYPIMVSYGANGNEEFKGIADTNTGCGVDSATIQTVTTEAGGTESKLIIAGGVNSAGAGQPVKLFVARYSIGGNGTLTLDPSFGTGGNYVAQVGNFPILGHDNPDSGRLSVSIQKLAGANENKIVVSGGAAIGGQDRFVFATRLTENGILDANFGANIAPAAVNDTVVTNYNTPVTIPVASILSNDVDPDVGQTPTFVSFTNAANGTVAESNGVLTYTPRTGFFGSDSFTYTVRDIEGPEGKSDTATVTVTVNSPPRTLSINDKTVTEGDRGTLNAVFTVFLDDVNAVAVSFDYATLAGSATEGADFAPRSGRITIPAGALSTTISIPVYGDRSAEGTETFTVNLSNPDGGATIADGLGIGTILDNDGGASSSGVSSAALATAARKKAARPTPATLAASAMHQIAVSQARAVDQTFFDFGSAKRKSDRTGLAADLAGIDFLFPQ